MMWLLLGAIGLVGAAQFTWRSVLLERLAVLVLVLGVLLVLRTVHAPELASWAVAVPPLFVLGTSAAYSALDAYVARCHRERAAMA